jgi:hypothetical protein
MGTFLQDARFAEELTFNTATGAGAYLPFSTALLENPAIIVFDNQSTVAVTISDDGTTNGKTFAIGEAMVLDLRTNASSSDELTWRKGTQFYANCAAGVGNFLISLVYAS